MPNTISIGNAHNAAEEWLQGELHSQDTQGYLVPRIPMDTQRYSVIPKIHYLLDSRLLVLGLDKKTSKDILVVTLTF